jgi:tetratricopeptide (TPR) repeat protein
MGMSGVIDQAYGFVYTELNHLDSGLVYLNRALPYFEASMNAGSKLGIYLQLAKVYDKRNDNEKALMYYQKSKELAETNGILEVAITASKKLDSVYTKMGDYKNASRYTAVYYSYKDSLSGINKEKELTQVEAADEQQRLARQLKEEQELKRRKNNIQYMSIIIGIVILFITLVVLGMFRVSATLIRAMGFFVFLLFFEFIFLIFKKNIYSVTHGEPWKDLAFMIALAALLVPLHHWLEHKVMHYLTSHNRLTAAGEHLARKFYSKKKIVSK